MELKAFLSEIGEERLAAFAEKVRSTPGTLKQIARGHRNCGETLAMRIERESERKVTVEEIRPDVPWHIVRGLARKNKPAEIA